METKDLIRVSNVWPVDVIVHQEYWYTTQLDYHALGACWFSVRMTDMYYHRLFQWLRAATIHDRRIYAVYSAPGCSSQVKSHKP